jgi:endonuclease/exonuclease/phosphatase (EEP) superfamily protein YafD
LLRRGTTLALASLAGAWVAHAVAGEAKVALVLLHATTPLWAAAAWPLAFVAWAQRDAPRLAAALTLAALHATTMVGAPRGEGELRVVTANLYVDNPDPRAALDALAALDAEVVLLQELTPPVALEIAAHPGLAAWPHRALLPRDDPYGVGVLSRLPLGAPEAHDAAGSPILAVAVEGLRGVEGVATVHLDAPDRAANLARWAKGRDAVAAWLAAHPGWMFAGDLNCTPTMPCLAQLTAGGGHVDAGAAGGCAFRPTWPALAARAPMLPLLALDHVLLPALGPAPGAARTSPIPGSDHRALQVSLTADPTPPTR